MATYVPVAVHNDGNDFLTKGAGAIGADSTDFTLRFAIKVPSNPAANTYLHQASNNRWRVHVTAAGLTQVYGQSDNATVCLNAFYGTSICNNAWRHIIWSRIGTGDCQFQLDGVLTAITMFTNTGVAINFAEAASTGHAVFANQAGTAPVIGDVADFWFKAGTGITLATGANDFCDASGALKDLGASGVAHGITPDTWLHRPVATWHINDGALGDVYTLNGTLTAAADAPPGVQTGGMQPMPRFSPSMGSMLVR